MVDDANSVYLQGKTDSISVSRTSTGKHSFDVKIYCENLTDSTVQESVISQLKAIHEQLRVTFPDEVKG